MPRYISVTPTFNPISTEEYLRVPMLLAKEYSDEQEKVENYKDRLSYIKALMGDEGKDTFKEYDEIMNSISDNPTLSNMREQGKKLREIYREIGSRADIAKSNRDKYQAMFDKDPSLVGDVGSFYQYYMNPEFRPSMISGSDLQKAVGVWATQKAAQRAPKFRGYVDKNKSQMMYSTGFSNDEMGAFIADAISGAPQTAEGAELAAVLDQYGYSGASAQDKASLARYIVGGMSAGSEKVSTMNNPNFMNPTQALAYRRGLLAEEEEKKNLEETGHRKPSAQDKSWVPVTLPDGTKVKRKLYSSGAYWELKSDGTQEYHPAPPKAGAADASTKELGLKSLTKLGKTRDKDEHLDPSDLTGLRESPFYVEQGKIKYPPKGRKAYIDDNGNYYIGEEATEGSTTKGADADLFDED